MADSQVLKRLDFPAYCIKLLDNGLIALTGGGGTSKTGVGNSIELGFITYSETQQAEFKQIHKFDSEDAIMKFVSFTCERTIHSELKLNDESAKNLKLNRKNTTNDLYIAAAVNQTIEIYKIKPNVNIISDNLDQEIKSTIINRKKSSSTSNQNGTVVRKDDKVKLEAGASIKLVNTIKLFENNSDNSNSEINPNNNNQEDSIVTIQVYKSKKNKQILLCAGTTKGNIIVWNLFSENNNNITDSNKTFNWEKLNEFHQAHTNEIDDLQISSDGLMLSIGKDSKCLIWSLESMKKLTEFNYVQTLNNDKNMRIKHARFSANSNYLYTTYIPRVRGGTKNMSSFIQKWSRSTDKSTPFGYKLEKTVRIKNTILTCVQTSKDGYFVCAGDCDGKIYLYDYEFNKMIDFKKQHSSVITDLVFYYDQEIDLNNLNESFDLNKFILTISIDRTLQLYKFLNLDLTNRFLFDLNKNRMMMSNNHSKNSLNLAVFNLLSCCLSMNLFKFIFILIVFFALFCYFFTHIE